MVNLTGIIINSVMISGLYAVIAIGFTLIFGVGNDLNLAHGEFITIGAYITFVIMESLGFSGWYGLILSTVAAGVVSAAFYYSILRKIESKIVVMLLTLIFAFVIRHVIRLEQGAQTTFIISPFFSGSIDVYGISVQKNMVFIFIISWILIGFVFYLVNRTEVGQAILATSMSAKGSSLVGIKQDHIVLIVWLLAGSFAGFAGALLISVQPGSWDMGFGPLVLAFSIVILGGLGSIRGSVIAAYVIGFLETVTVTFDPRLRGLVSLSVLLVIITVRPQGLFGKQSARDLFNK